MIRLYLIVVKGRQMSKKCTLEEFITISKSIHGDEYDYTYVIYIGMKTKVEIKCNTCFDVFLQTPSDHIFKKSGCPNCGGVKKHNNTSFIAKAIIKHPPNKYDYSNINYINARTPVSICCNDCNTTFLQLARDHLSGYGCPECPRIKIRWELKEIIQAFTKIHNNNYDYSEVIYVNIETKIKIICNKCKNIFEQKPGSHLQGNGCPNCCANNISKQEISWLDHLSISQDNRNIWIVVGDNRFKVDGLDLQNNTIYEFNGDYWHGNPNIFNQSDINKNNKRTFGELYQKTLKREEILKSAGYNLISIWESDWRKQCQKISA